MDLTVSNPVAFVSDATAAVAVTDSIASLVGVATSQVSVTLSTARRLATPSHAAAAQRGVLVPAAPGGQLSKTPTWSPNRGRRLSSVLVSYSITTIGGPGTSADTNSGILSALTDSDAASAMQNLTTTNLESQGASYTVTVESLSVPTIESVIITATSITTTLSTTSAITVSSSSTVTTTATISSTLTTWTTTTTISTWTTSSITTATTTSASTTISTTTTIGALSLVAIPTELTSCNSLVVYAAVPDDTIELTWSCEPVESQLCANILSVAAGGAVLTTLQVSSDLVSDAAAKDVSNSDLVSETSPMSVSLTARGVNQYGGLSLGSTTFTFDVFATGFVSLVKAASTTEYTLLDDYVRLSTNAILCDGDTVGWSIDVAWSWRAAGEALWTEWTNPAGVAYTSFKMPITELDGATGDFEVKASIVGSEAGDTIFDVTVGDIPPPDARVALPARASKDCDFPIDASSSTDPSGADLSFAWACDSDNSSQDGASDEAAAACSEMVAGETASAITIAGGSLPTGDYRFTVTVSRADANSTAQGSVLVTGSVQPVVSFGELAAEVSPQQPLALSAAVAESDTCVAPAWKAWWLLEPGGGASLLAASAETGLAELSLPSLSAAPGTYQLRLVLSMSEYHDYVEDGNSDVYVFDSAYFLIDEPPTGGSCEVFPSGGSAVLTKLTLSSFYWLDDDLPLLHKFSKCLGAVGSGCDSWSTVSAYSQSETMQNVLLSDEPGMVTIRADAKDTLGSSSAAVTEVEVTELTEPVSDDALLDVVASVASFGDPFATLAALSVVADSSGGGNQEFSGVLLDTMSDSGALSDLDSESIEATSAVLATIVTSASAVQSGDGANGTAQEVVIEMEVAAKAASLVTDIAVAAKSLDEGMEVETARLLISSVATLLNTATGTGGGARSDVQAAQQEALSDQLRQAIEAIGDAVIQATAVGETVTMNTSSGLQLNVMKVDNAELAVNGAILGGFTLPAMPGLAAGRRLESGRVLTSGEAIGLLNAVWHQNPFSYAGSTAPAPEPSTGVASDLSITMDGVRSFSIRLGGEEVTVRDLETPIMIELPRHSDAERRRLSEHRRLSGDLDETVVEQVEECMYFNHTGEVWSTEGCAVAEVSGSTLVCECSHLSFFSSALGSLSLPVDLLCPDVDILAPAGFEKLGQGEWAQQRGGVVLWTLLAVLLVAALIAYWSQGSRKVKPIFFMYSDDSRTYSRTVVLERMMSAGRKSGKSRPKILLVFAISVVLRLRLDCDYEELCQNDVSEIIRTLVFYKLMLMWVTATMGFSELDPRYLRHGNMVKQDAEGTSRATSKAKVGPAPDDGVGSGDDPGEAQGAASREPSQSVDPLQPLGPAASDGGGSGDDPGEAQGAASLEPSQSPAGSSPARDPAASLGNGLTDEFVAVLMEKSRLLQRRRHPADAEAGQPDASAAADQAVTFATDTMVLYKAIHPLYKLLLHSMTMPWIFQIVALLDAVFGSLMLSAAFYGASASPNIPECVDPDDLPGSLFRDMLVSLGCTVVALVPLAILSRRDRTMPRVSTDGEARRQLRTWLLKDVACIVGGLLWFAFSVLYIMLFLANVSSSDADHWLITLIIRLASTWLLLPLIAIILWMIIMRSFARLNGGSFIESNIKGLLRAVSRDDGDRDRPKPSLPIARGLADPPPLPPLLAAGAAGGDAGGGVWAPLDEPPGSVMTASENEQQFRAWVDHVRASASDPAPSRGSGHPLMEPNRSWPHGGSQSDTPLIAPADWMVPPPPLLDAPRPPPPWVPTVASRRGRAALGREEPGPPPLGLESFSNESSRNPGGLRAAGGGLPPGSSADLGLSAGLGLPPPPSLEGLQPPPPLEAARPAVPPPPVSPPVSPPRPRPGSQWALPGGADDSPGQRGADAAGAEEAPRSGSPGARLSQAASAARLSQVDQLLALSPLEAARRMLREQQPGGDSSSS